MTKNQKIALGIALAIGAYFYFSKSDKQKTAPFKPTPPQNTSEDNNLVSQYQINPLPDIKGAKYTSVTPIMVAGATSSSPIIIATR
jgi:hypothetical protein